MANIGNIELKKETLQSDSLSGNALSGLELVGAYFPVVFIGSEVVGCDCFHPGVALEDHGEIPDLINPFKHVLQLVVEDLDGLNAVVEFEGLGLGFSAPKTIEAAICFQQVWFELLIAEVD